MNYTNLQHKFYSALHIYIIYFKHTSCKTSIKLPNKVRTVSEWTL